jgi:urease accessory protein
VSGLSVIALLASAASAHPGHGAGGGFAAGVYHPVSGIDHILAMIAVGLLAAQIGGRAMWVLPAAFISLMTGGGLLASTGHVQVPWVEQMIAASVLVLGLLIATSARMPLMASVSLVAFFAMFHGYAHVAEMTVGASALSYSAGFVLATAALHAVGLAIGLQARRLAPMAAVRLGGAGIAACGLLLGAGVI